MRGLFSPLFYTYFEFILMKELAEKLLTEALDENPQLFLVDFSIDHLSKITVVVDGDEGVSVKECVRISRHIEHNLIEEYPELDFGLDVLSPGLDRPLTSPRQFKKNIGRNLLVQLADQSEYKGKLTAVEGTLITLQWKTREPKLIGKGKHTVEKEEKIEIEKINKAIVQVTF